MQKRARKPGEECSCGKKRLGLREKYSDEKVVFVCQNLRMCVRIGMDFRVSSHSTELGMIWNREMGGTKVMETEKQAKIDQHYVPRFYLKNFALVKGTGRKLLSVTRPKS